MYRSDIVADDAGGVVAVEHHVFNQRSGGESVILDDALGAIRYDKAVIGSNHAYAAVIRTYAGRVSADNCTRTPLHIEVTAHFLWQEGAVFLSCAASAEYIARYRNHTHGGAVAAYFQRGTKASVKEIACNIVAVAIGEYKSAAVIPLYAVARAGYGCHHRAAHDSAAKVGGEPVVQYKCVPAVNIKASALVSVDHGVPY